jgi:hypothetical protein
MTTKSKPNIFERLANPNSYTGVYAERFRTGGKINAHAGNGNIHDLSQITRPQLSGSSTSIRMGRGIPGSHVTSGMVMDTPSTRLSPVSTPPGSPGAQNQAKFGSPQRTSSSPQLKKQDSSSTIESRNSIFDRLSSEASFTGVYAERFKTDGRINAHDRDDIIIRDLSQITRQNLNLNSPDSRSHTVLVRSSSSQTNILRSPPSPGGSRCSPSHFPRSPISKARSSSSLLFD